MEQSQQLGKRVILISQGDQSDLPRQQFAFASYLLIAQGDASFRYTNSVSAYDKVWLYANYTTDLGAPKAAKYLVNSVWRRDFTKGYVLVNPVNHTGQIVLDGSTTTPLPPPPTNGTTATHVSKLTLWYRTVANSTNYQMNTEVRVATATGGIPPSTNVTLTTVLPDKTQAVSIVTADQYGFANFSVQSSLKGTYTSTVTNVSGVNISYDKATNVASSLSKTIK
jgi:hypothetical protein